jgi:hypothetical protein
LSGFRHDEVLCSPIYWGAHEQLRGNRDFYRSPRLNLERYLSLLHEKGLKTEILLGFSPSPETFPEWTLSVEKKSAIAECLWKPESPAYSLYEIPSLLDVNIQQGFCDFANEVLSQLALYRAPGGPIERIHLDLSAYARSWSPGEISEFSRRLEREYGSLSLMNQIFQTSFSNFDGLRARQGIRALCDKRAWILTRIYKKFREEHLQGFRNAVLTLPGLEPVKDIFSLREIEGASPGETAWVIDDTLFDWGMKNEPIPLCPWGVISTAGAAALRTAEYFYYCAGQRGKRLARLPDGESLEKIPVTWVIISGKYLSEGSIKNLQSLLSNGSKFFFPFGLPQYTERLSQINWGFSKTVIKEENGLRINFCGKGRMYEPLKALGVSEALGDTVNGLFNRVIESHD